VRKKLILIGGGGHCKSCIDVIEQSEQYEIAGIIDKQENIGQMVLGYEIIGIDNQIETLATEGFEFLITIGQKRTPQVRQKLYNELMRCNAKIAMIISPRAYVSKHAVIGKGTIVMHDVLINADAIVGKNCIINSKSLIEHDVIVEDHCHISTSAVLNGGVRIKAGTFFGSNAVSKEYVATPNEAFIKAGSLFLGENDG
jgi:sugar O-acyltransferase (sialic acid O-acetyltransferase NeuD family)